jgi:hypothetical protein
VTGGAIYILGASRYHVLDSVFSGNAVAPATWARTASYGLMLSTAQAGASDKVSPMWSIDDGPVFGLSATDCGLAQLASAQGVGRGLTPSWPGDAPCANDTVYRSFELYTHSMKLVEGDHVLHVGAFTRTGELVQWAGGGKIEVVGLLSPMFPAFDDDRTTLRHPGCMNAIGYDAHACPAGEAFWVDLPMHVAVGKVRRATPTAFYRQKKEGGEAYDNL